MACGCARKPGREGERPCHRRIHWSSVGRAVEAAARIQLNEREKAVAGRVLHEIRERLQFLNAVGLGYISLSRSAATLIRRRRPAHTAGNANRITSARSSLRSRRTLHGLHHRDNDRLLQALEALRDLGNTVLVVEHDEEEETIRRADYVIDLGPGAGLHGGEVVASGTPNRYNP